MFLLAQVWPGFGAGIQNSVGVYAFEKVGVGAATARWRHAQFALRFYQRYGTWHWPVCWLGFAAFRTGGGHGDHCDL